MITHQQNIYEAPALCDWFCTFVFGIAPEGSHMGLRQSKRLIRMSNK